MDKKIIKLGPAGKRFRRKVLSEYVFTKTHDLERLDMLAQILDRLELCDGEINAENAFFTTNTGQKRENPALKTERELKIVFCRIIRELCLDAEELDENRPPKLKT